MWRTNMKFTPFCRCYIIFECHVCNLEYMNFKLIACKCMYNICIEFHVFKTKTNIRTINTKYWDVFGYDLIPLSMSIVDWQWIHVGESMNILIMRKRKACAGVDVHIISSPMSTSSFAPGMWRRGLLWARASVTQLRNPQITLSPVVCSHQSTPISTDWVFQTQSSRNSSESLADWSKRIKFSFLSDNDVHIRDGKILDGVRARRLPDTPDMVEVE